MMAWALGLLRLLRLGLRRLGLLRLGLLRLGLQLPPQRMLLTQRPAQPPLL